MNNNSKNETSESQNPYLSVIMPAYNEATRIPATLEKVIDFLKNQNWSWELLIVDDGSVDKTIEVVKGIIDDLPGCKLLENKHNRGKGYSIKHGMMAANGQYRLFSDADLSTPIEEIQQFIEFHEQGCDICIGSRSLPSSNVEIHQPWYREKMGKTFGLLQKLFILDNIIDSQCGFKSFNQKAAGIVFPKQLIEGFCFDVELLHIAQKHKLKIKEVPVTWRDNPDTKVGALTDSSKMFLDLLKIKINSLRGLYK